MKRGVNGPYNTRVITQPIDYLPVFLFILLTIAFAIGTIILSLFVQNRLPLRAKLAAYECGARPVSDARMPFPMRYYIIALLFVIFDIEAIFLYPWAITFERTGVLGFVTMVLFIALFLIGYAYAWRKGGLEWD